MGMITQGRLGVSLNHQLKAGIAYEAIVNSSVLINGSLNLDVEKLKMESKFQPPQHNHTLVSVKAKPFTYSLSGEEMPKKVCTCYILLSQNAVSTNENKCNR